MRFENWYQIVCDLQRAGGEVVGPYLYWKTAPQGPNCLSLRLTFQTGTELDSRKVGHNHTQHKNMGEKIEKFRNGFDEDMILFNHWI